MGVAVSQVDLGGDPVLCRVLTDSSTVYYVSTLGEHPAVLRAPGAGRTHRDSFDSRWIRLRGVVSFPVGAETPRFGVDAEGRAPVAALLRRGSRHAYYWDTEPPRRSAESLAEFWPRISDSRWWIQRLARRVEVLEAMPSVLTRGSDEVDFTDGPEPGEGW